MITLSAKIREGNEKLEALRGDELLPAVIYGSKVENISLIVNEKAFEAVYKDAGSSSLVFLEIEGKKDKALVLIHDVQKDSLSGKFIHVDFYQPSLKEETEAKVPFVFEGESLAVKDLGGTLIKNFQEIEVKALPQDLPSGIRINLEALKTFEDNILVSDLDVAPGVKILKEPEEVIVSVIPAQKVEEELEKPIEDKVEDVEQAGEKKEDVEKDSS